MRAARPATRTTPNEAAVSDDATARRARSARRAPPDRAARHARRARKRYGQHFLERPWVDKVLRAVAPRDEEIVLEIGPGRGALTLPLLAAVRHVIAFEIDRDLAGALRAEGRPNLTVVEGDVLDVTQERITDVLHEAGLGGAPLRLVGNLPYNVASPILFKVVELVEHGLPIRDAIVMIQREVADRIVAPVGTSDYGVLGVLLRHVAQVDRLLALPPGAFRPAPDVHSSLLGLRLHPADPMPADLGVLRGLVRAAFTRRRKTLGNALEACALPPGLDPAEALRRAGVDPRLRPEALDVAGWVRLADVLVASGAGHMPRVPAGL